MKKFLVLFVVFLILITPLVAPKIFRGKPIKSITETYERWFFSDYVDTNNVSYNNISGGGPCNQPGPCYGNDRGDSAFCPTKNYCVLNGICYPGDGSIILDLDGTDKHEAICIGKGWWDCDTGLPGMEVCELCGHNWTKGETDVGEYLWNYNGYGCCGDDEGEVFNGTDCIKEERLMYIYEIDVGQGDSFLLKAPNGDTMLIDSGKNGNEFNILNFMNTHNITHLNYTLASHYHEDHIGSLDYVLSYFPVDKALDRGGGYTTTAYTNYVTAAGDRRQTLYLGNEINFGGDEVNVEVVHVVNSFSSSSGQENKKSIVIRADYNEIGLLFGGDCETTTCEYTFNPGDLEIYKVHHHGSSDSSGTNILNQMTPEVALIPVGLGNPYGHPHPETLSRLASKGVEVYRTDLDGDITITTNGETYEITTEY